MRILTVKGYAVVLVAVACFTSGPARAGVMLSPVAVTESDLGTNDPVTPLVNLINQSGLDKPFTSGVTDFDAYFMAGDPAYSQGGQGEWWSAVDFTLPVEGAIDFDLGGAYEFQRLAIWNRSLGDIDILVSDAPTGPFVPAGNVTLPNKLNFAFSNLAEEVSLDSPQRGRYLRIQVNSAYPFAPFDTFAYAIANEIVLDVQPLSAGPAADFDNDGDVDGDDLTEWRAAFGASALADADGDMDSDGVDLLTWQRELGLAIQAPLTRSLPEPGLAASLAACAAIIVRRWQVSRRLRAPRA